MRVPRRVIAIGAMVAGAVVLWAWPNPKITAAETERELKREHRAEAARCIKAHEPPREDENGVPIRRYGPWFDYECRIKDEQGWTEPFLVFVDGDSITGQTCLRC